MSGSSLDKLWDTAQNGAAILLGLDQNIQTNQTPQSKREALKAILPIYIKYRNLVKKLAELYDRMIHSQKRESIKRLFDCSVGRMLEYRREIVKLTCSEYHWPDDLLIKMKWTPDDIEIPQILSYTADRRKQLEDRKKMIQDVIDKLNNPEPEVEPNQDEQIFLISELTRPPELVRPRKSVKFTIAPALPVPIESQEEKVAREKAFAAKKALADAILLIQRHERARLGRVIGINADKDNKYQDKLRRNEIELKKYKKEVKEKAATKIQKIWRGYCARRAFEKRREGTEMALEMLVPSHVDKTVFEIDVRHGLRIQELQEKFRNAVQELFDQEKMKIFERRKLDTMDDIAEEIRAWFQEWLSAVGHFDIFPEEQNGGSVLIATGQTLTPQEFLAKKLEEKSGNDQKKKDKKEQKKGTKKEKKSADEKKKNEGYVVPESKVLQAIIDVKNDFIKNWSLRDEKSCSIVNIDLIKEAIFHERQMEMRKIVDEFMRLELDRMNDALIKDHKNDKPKFKFPGMKKGKKKKGRKRGKKKTKKTEEPTNETEIDEMFRELIASGIIKNYPEAKLSDWFGDYSYQNFEAQRDLKDYKHALGDLKSVIVDICVLPLGSKQVHTIAPLIRSVCITGLPRSGKTFLAHGIANEIGALLFDLSPSVLAGKYEGKEDEKRLIKMINTVAKNNPPSIVLIDGGDKPWWKKVPIEEKENQPKRLAKILPKFIRAIKPGDQILVLGLASEPWKATKKFAKIYENFIIIPPTDYNSVHQFYQNILMKYHYINRNFDISSLAQASAGYSLDIIREAVESVLNLKRRMRLKFDPLKGSEILRELQKYPSTPQKILDQYAKFPTKTPLGKKFTKMMKEERENLNPSIKKK